MMARRNVRRMDLNILRENVRLIGAALPTETGIMAVVKADAYGHGLVPTAEAALDAGASWLVVARVSEGVALRDAGVAAPILVLGPAAPDELSMAVLHEIRLTACSAGMIHETAAAARLTGQTAYVHLKLDTGMSRIGARSEAEVREALAAAEQYPQICLEGVFTHFADADGDDMTFTHQQLERFIRWSALLPEDVIRHCANSAAIHRLPEARFDLVRAGISMYGYPPVPTDMALRPVMDWTTHVTYVKDIAPGDAVSYGCTFRADRPMRIATIACGYGDGYHRHASGRAKVIIRGQYAPVVGRICMDQMMADVTDIAGVVPGDTVTLMGRDGDAVLTAEDLAAWADTISYEVLLAATGRVEREWLHRWEDKQTIRHDVRQGAGNAVQRRLESREICRHILHSDAFRKAKTVAAYVPMRHEADVTSVLAGSLAAGKTLLLPRMEQHPDRMTLRQTDNLADLRPGRWGIPEPPETAREASAEEADLVIVPLEAIDRQGWRLGKGGGYYDRLLARIKEDTVTMGAVLSWQWVSDVPRDQWDLRLTAACDRQGVRTF